MNRIRIYAVREGLDGPVLHEADAIETAAGYQVINSIWYLQHRHIVPKGEAYVSSGAALKAWKEQLLAEAAEHERKAGALRQKAELGAKHRHVIRRYVGPLLNKLEPKPDDSAVVVPVAANPGEGA